MISNRVLLVSAFGRGHWLAAQLAQMGIPTTLIDLSEKLGSWVPEESEGPFGIFQDEKLSKSQLERFLEDDSVSEIQNGFTIWLKSGPLELKGPINNHRLRQLGVQDVVQSYLLNANSELHKKVQNLTFADNWLAQIAHSYPSHTFHSNKESIEHGESLPLMTTFSTRLPSRQGHYKSLQWCRRQGVDVIEKSTVKEIIMKDRNRLRGIEYQEDQSEKNQILECDQLIWSLSSEESSLLGSSVVQNLFPMGSLEPEWYWARYRLKISNGPVRDELPAHALVIEDLGLPWYHNNFIVLTKTGSVDFFDAWIRLPHNQRFNKAYLETRGQELVEVLIKKMINLKIEIASYPLGYDLTFNQIGPARQPLYDEVKLNQWSSAKISNVFFDCVENQIGLGWRFQFIQQQQVLEKLDLWWKKVLLKKAKENKTSRAEI